MFRFELMDVCANHRDVGLRYERGTAGMAVVRRSTRTIGVALGARRLGTHDQPGNVISRRETSSSDMV